MSSSKRTGYIHKVHQASCDPQEIGGFPCPDIRLALEFAERKNNARRFAYIFRFCVPLEVWLDGLILLVELGQIRNEVLHYVGVWKRIHSRLLCGVSRDTACKS